METLADVTCVLYIIADSVGARLREIGLRGKCIPDDTGFYAALFRWAKDHGFLH